MEFLRIDPAGLPGFEIEKNGPFERAVSVFESHDSGRGGRLLALASPSSGGFLADQDTRADVEGAGHLPAVLVEQLHADAMTHAKFFNAVSVRVVGCVDLGRLSSRTFRARQ